MLAASRDLEDVKQLVTLIRLFANERKAKDKLLPFKLRLEISSKNG